PELGKRNKRWTTSSQNAVSSSHVTADQSDDSFRRGNSELAIMARRGGLWPSRLVLIIVLGCWLVVNGCAGGTAPQPYIPLYVPPPVWTTTTTHTTSSTVTTTSTTLDPRWVYFGPDDNGWATFVDRETMGSNGEQVWVWARTYVSAY